MIERIFKFINDISVAAVVLMGLFTVGYIFYQELADARPADDIGQPVTGRYETAKIPAP